MEPLEMEMLITSLNIETGFEKETNIKTHWFSWPNSFMYSADNHYIGVVRNKQGVDNSYS